MKDPDLDEYYNSEFHKAINDEFMKLLNGNNDILKFAQNASEIVDNFNNLEVLKMVDIVEDVKACCEMIMKGFKEIGVSCSIITIQDVVSLYFPEGIPIELKNSVSSDLYEDNNLIIVFPDLYTFAKIGDLVWNIIYFKRQERDNMDYLMQAFIQELNNRKYPINVSIDKSSSNHVYSIKFLDKKHLEALKNNKNIVFTNDDCVLFDIDTYANTALEISKAIIKKH